MQQPATRRLDSHRCSLMLCRQHKAAMRQAAGELAQRDAVVPELHQQAERAARDLQASQQEVHMLKACPCSLFASK